MKFSIFTKDATIRINSLSVTKLQSHLVEVIRIAFVSWTMMSKLIIAQSFIVKIATISFPQTETVELGSRLPKGFQLGACV